MVCAQVWSSDKALTCPGLLIHSQSLSANPNKEKKRVTENIVMFSKWENTQWHPERRWKSVCNTMILELPRPHSHRGSCDNNVTGVTVLSRYRSLWGNENDTPPPDDDNATLRCRDERRGRWGVSGSSFISKGSSRFSSRIKNLWGNYKENRLTGGFFIHGHYRRTHGYY